MTIRFRTRQISHQQMWKYEQDITTSKAQKDYSYDHNLRASGLHKFEVVLAPIRQRQDIGIKDGSNIAMVDRIS
jgi:hypothetical protein